MTRVCIKCGKPYNHTNIDSDYRCLKCKNEYMKRYEVKQHAFRKSDKYIQLSQMPLNDIADEYLKKHPIKEVEVLWRYLHLKYGV